MLVILVTTTLPLNYNSLKTYFPTKPHVLASIDFTYIATFIFNIELLTYFQRKINISNVLKRYFLGLGAKELHKYNFLWHGAKMVVFGYRAYWCTS